MNNLREIIGEYEPFLKRLLSELAEAGFDLDDFVQLDHIGYWVPSLDYYAEKKRQLDKAGTLLDEVEISGRPISVYRLQPPIRYDRWRIDALELVSPREGATRQEGLEHAEFVIYDDQSTFLEKYAGKQFDMHAAERGINPEVGYSLPSCRVKFHLINLPAAVYLQRKTGIV